MKKISVILSLFLICTSCASPTVVNVIGPNDNKLSCEELSNEIAKANQYADEAQKAKNLGFAGKGSVHPKQIGLLNAIFTPSDENIARARRIIKTFEDADTGLVVIDGKLIEKPVMREMYRIETIANKLGK